MTDLIYLVCVGTYMARALVICRTAGGVWWDNGGGV